MLDHADEVLESEKTYDPDMLATMHFRDWTSLATSAAQYRPGHLEDLA